MSFEQRDYLRQILAEADYLTNHSAGLTADRFMADDTLRRAFVRSLEIIGEAAKKITDDFRAQHPAVEWRWLECVTGSYTTTSVWITSLYGT